jgi:hypothetical protein
VTVDEQPPDTGGAQPASAGGGWWQRLRVPVIVAVVALAGLLYVAVNHRNESTSANGATPAPGAAGSTTPSTTPSAASSPACLPTVVETGFGVTGKNVDYGFIARSDCPQATYNIVISTRVFDPAGREIGGQNEVLPEVNVVLPGQQVGGAGRFYLTTVRPVGRVEVRVTRGRPAPVSAFAGWPNSVRVTDLEYQPVRGAPDRTTVTGQIVTAPARAVLCAPHTSLILRDAGGKIIYAIQGQVHSTSVTFELAIPAAADRRKTTAFVSLGEVAFSVDAVSTASCRS